MNPVDMVFVFCNGKCTEASRLEELCPACKQEWHDYQQERS